MTGPPAGRRGAGPSKIGSVFGKGMTSLMLLSLAMATGVAQPKDPRPRARDLGVAPGVYEPGPLNAITDVPGVLVGHCTLSKDESIRTGVTAILPHAGNLFQEKVPAAVHVYNAFGKLAGSTQIQELGQIETPILLTNTLSVWDAAAALAHWTLQLPGNEDVRSVNPVVGETNDGYLNDIRGRHVKAGHVLAAIRSAKAGPVAEGNVGAGTGTVAFGWKGGIGTSSRRVPLPAEGGPGPAYLLGVLVQTNFGGHLTIDGVPVWRSLQPERRLARLESQPPADAGGSCMIVLATNAPLDARQLERLAARAIHGMAKTGSSGSHGSGDYVIAFSTAYRIPAHSPTVTRNVEILDESRLSPLFQSALEATEEAIYNSLLQAGDARGMGGHEALAVPVAKLRELLKDRR